MLQLAIQHCACVACGSARAAGVRARAPAGRRCYPCVASSRVVVPLRREAARGLTELGAPEPRRHLREPLLAQASTCLPRQAACPGKALGNGLGKGRASRPGQAKTFWRGQPSFLSHLAWASLRDNLPGQGFACPGKLARQLACACPGKQRLPLMYGPHGEATTSRWCGVTPTLRAKVRHVKLRGPSSDRRARCHRVHAG